MIIKVESIGSGETFKASAEYKAGEIDVEFDDLHYIHPITFEAEVDREGNTLHVRGQLTSVTEQSCARCLSVITCPVREPVNLFYDTTHAVEVDTLEDLREILVLAHDPKFLCKPDCRGLCPGCGADLNKEVCSCTGAGYVR